MGPGENVLIVEDEVEWRKNCERAMSSLRPEQTVMVAKNLAGAKRLIDSTKFAVALVHVGLDVSDDQNIDGLRVMQKICDADDETSITVVGGRTGQDVLPIIRDAIKRCGVYDPIGKSTVGPSAIRRLLEGGLEEYRSKAPSTRTNVRDVIKGCADGEYLLLVSPPDVDHTYHKENRIYGNYWSRTAAESLLICFGSETMFDEALNTIPGDTGILKSNRGRVLIKELVS